MRVTLSASMPTAKPQQLDKPQLSDFLHLPMKKAVKNGHPFFTTL